METIITSIFSGGVAGAALIWISRSWITERLQQSIRHEYSQKLETHKSELNLKLQSIKHDRELYNLRTSLFFDHQRKAFAEISSQLAKTKDEWFRVAFDPEDSFMEPVPNEEYIKFKQLIYDHQLFFDTECNLAIDLALQAMHDSFPFKETLYGPEEKIECQEPYERLAYIQERMIQLFQEKIGISEAVSAKTDLALLTLVRLLNENKHHISEFEIEDNIKLSIFENYSDAIEIAKQYINPFTEKCEELREYFIAQILYEESLLKLDNAMAILEKNKIQQANQL
ncbi:MAG: hypothetical protein ACI8ZB_005304 [Desulforhopalus sp.]|jgi:hypothetical protein